MSCNGGGSGVTAVIMTPVMMGVNIMSGGGSTDGITNDVAVDRSSGSSNDGARGMLPAAVLVIGSSLTAGIISGVNIAASFRATTGTVSVVRVRSPPFLHVR